MRLYAAAVALALLPAAEDPAPGFDHSHAAWTAVLAEHVHGDRFDYAAVKEDHAGIDAYLLQLRAVTKADLDAFTKEQRFAFWINAYNAWTIHKIVSKYPLESIRDLDRSFGLKSVFDEEFIPMRALHPEGKDDDLSLNDIEHGVLRPVFEDARVHAAVNCASFSCPPLRAEAFTEKELDRQLTQQMRAFVADVARNRFDDAGTARVSEIFKWFSEDFERDAGSVREYLVRFGAPETVRDAKLRYLDYDWDLNDVEREDG